MTVHPIDTEALRARLAPLAWHSTPPITTDHVRRVLDALAAAEHRATRAEAQAAIRGRAVTIHRARAREAEAERDAARKQYDEDIAYWIAATDAAEARIKAVRALHTGTRWPGVTDKPICDACDRPWPCWTIRALDA